MTAPNADDLSRYWAALHAMQTGVAAEMEYNAGPTSPKHLRVGVNDALSLQSGLVALLIEKGVFTEAEYIKAIADAMEREAQAYQQRINDHYGTGKITLK